MLITDRLMVKKRIWVLAPSKYKKLNNNAEVKELKVDNGQLGNQINRALGHLGVHTC